MNVPFARLPLAVAASALLLAGCSSVNEFLSGDRVDYKSAAKQTSGLEIPPDLTQLAREGRYTPTASVVSAAQQAGAPRAATAGAAPGAAVAANAVGDVRVVREGDKRWIATTQSPEQVWPQLKAFWLESGFTLLVDEPKIGILETDWAENRAKLPQDLMRRSLGRIFEGLYDSGTRDRFRVRVERTAAGGSEIFLTHRGLEEVATDKALETDFRWRQRGPDLQLEAEFLARLMVRLGSPEATARTVMTAAIQPAATTPRARRVEGATTPTLALDEGFDSAWRRVGLALDRTGFTVEDRNRPDGIYFVRYIASGPAQPAGFFQRLFGSDEAAAAQRFRITVKGSSDKSEVTVLAGDGQPAAADSGRRIAGVLLDELVR